MKIFNLVEIKKVEKEVKPMTYDEVNRIVCGMDPDDTVEEKKPKKKLRKRIVAGIGTGVAVLGAIAAVASRRSNSDVVDSGDDFANTGDSDQGSVDSGSTSDGDYTEE